VSDLPAGVSFRDYSVGDRSACLAVFDSIVPKYFHQDERPEFEAFIDSFEGAYFVLETGGSIAGCGGYASGEAGGLADLCWGMIASIHHGKGLGEMLLLARLQAGATRTPVDGVCLATSQHTDSFFRRYDFSTRSRETDGFASGLDKVEMRLDLSAAVRKQIVESWKASRDQNHPRRR